MKLWYGKLMLQCNQLNKRKNGEKKTKAHPQKFAPTLALKRYTQDLIGQAKLFDISAANQNHGSKCIFSPGFSHLARKFCRGQFVIWMHMLIIIMVIIIYSHVQNYLETRLEICFVFFTSLVRY